MNSREERRLGTAATILAGMLAGGEDRSNQTRREALYEADMLIRECECEEEPSAPTAPSDAERWKLEDSAAAASQGWDVFQADQLEIQRIDSPESGEAPRFDSDAQALVHVYDLALRGDPLCRKAMAVTLAEANIRR